jgi:CRISPR type I-F-associated protein Csy3
MSVTNINEVDVEIAEEKKAEAEAKNKINAKLLNIPETLSIRKSVSPSNGKFKGLNSNFEEVEELKVTQGTVLGTKSQYDASDTDAGEANPATLEKCVMEEATILREEATAQFLSLCDQIMFCNNKTFRYEFMPLMNEWWYNNGYYKDLAHYYVCTMLNGTLGFRNNDTYMLVHSQIDDVTRANVVNNLIDLDEDTIYNNIKDLKNFTYTDDEMDAIENKIAETWAGINPWLTVNIINDFNVSTVENGQREIYPSQLWTQKPDRRTDDTPTKVLKKDKHNHPLMSSEKIGNGLRTFDIWYKDFARVKRPLPINPFGYNHGDKVGERLPTSDDNFYILFSKLYSEYLANPNVTSNTFTTTLSREQVLFVLGNLIRGGMYSSKS